MVEMGASLHGALLYIRNLFHFLTFQNSKLPKTVAKKNKKYGIIFMLCTVSRFPPIYIFAIPAVLMISMLQFTIHLKMIDLAFFEEDLILRITDTFVILRP